MSADHPTLRIGRYRWVICALLFAATAINYIDRQTIGVLKPTLQAELRWTESSYADIVFWFQCAYAIGYLGFGPIIDRIGARLGYALAFSVWTLAHIGHGFVHSITQFAERRRHAGPGLLSRGRGGAGALDNSRRRRLPGAHREQRRTCHALLVFRKPGPNSDSTRRSL